MSWRTSRASWSASPGIYKIRLSTGASPRGTLPHRLKSSSSRPCRSGTFRTLAATLTRLESASQGASSGVLEDLPRLLVSEPRYLQDPPRCHFTNDWLCTSLHYTKWYFPSTNSLNLREIHSYTVDSFIYSIYRSAVLNSGSTVPSQVPTIDTGRDPYGRR